MNSKTEKKNTKAVIFLVLIILVGMIRLIYIYSLRDGHHVDETWSYGFANSYYEPNVFGWADESHWKNIGEWVSGDVFKDYITVSSDQRFSFDSVWYNKQNDLSPIVYAFLLHFVSSFFPGVFSWNFAFAISLVFFVLTVIFVFLISREFTGSSLCGCLCSLYYVFSGCGTGNFLYLRVYHILTFLTLCLFYLMMRVYKADKDTLKAYLPLPIVTLLGCLTHFYFLILAFFFTAFFCIGFLFRKRIASFFRIGFTMLFSVIAFFVIYPASLRFLIPYSGGRSTGSTAVTGYYSYPYGWELRIANIHFFGSTIGFSIDCNLITLFEILVFTVMILLCFALLSFVFRNERWMIKMFHQIKNIRHSLSNYIVSVFSVSGVSAAVALASSVLTLIVIPYSARLYGMKYVERYFFAPMTLFIIFFVSFVFLSLKHLFINLKKSIARIISIPVILILSLMCILSNRYMRDFGFLDMREKELTNVLSGQDVFVYARFERDMIWLSPVLADANRVYIVLEEMTDKPDFAMPELDEGCFVLVASDGFITEEQRAEIEENGSYSVSTAVKPENDITLSEYLSDIKSSTGHNYELYDEFNTNIGMLNLYKIVP